MVGRTLLTGAGLVSLGICLSLAVAVQYAGMLADVRDGVAVLVATAGVAPGQSKSVPPPQSIVPLLLPLGPRQPAISPDVIGAMSRQSEVPAADRDALAAIARWLAGDRAGARALAESATVAYPHASLPLYARGIVRRGAGEFDGAVADFGRAADLAPGDPTFPIEIARTEVARPDYAAAADAFEAALALAPTDPALQHLVAAVYLDHALRVERGVALARSSSAGNPDDAEIWLLLGRGYTMARRFDEASLAVEQALRLAPNNPDLRAQVAELRRRRPESRGRSLSELREVVANLARLLPFVDVSHIRASATR